VVTPTIPERTVGPCILMVASTTGGAMYQLHSFVNRNCGRRQMNLRDKTRPDLGNGYCR